MIIRSNLIRENRFVEQKYEGTRDVVVLLKKCNFVLKYLEHHNHAMLLAQSLAHLILQINIICLE